MINTDLYGYTYENESEISCCQAKQEEIGKILKLLDSYDDNQDKQVAKEADNER